jgi:hypothetical protein
MSESLIVRWLREWERAGVVERVGSGWALSTRADRYFGQGLRAIDAELNEVA